MKLLNKKEIVSLISRHSFITFTDTIWRELITFSFLYALTQSSSGLKLPKKKNCGNIILKTFILFFFYSLRPISCLDSFHIFKCSKTNNSYWIRKLLRRLPCVLLRHRLIFLEKSLEMGIVDRVEVLLENALRSLNLLNVWRQKTTLFSSQLLLFVTWRNCKYNLLKKGINVFTLAWDISGF